VYAHIAKLRQLVLVCALAAVHVHVAPERLRRAKLALAEAARVRARRPLPVAGRVLGERAHFPGARFRHVRHVRHETPSFAPGTATHPTSVVHRPRLQQLLGLVSQDLGRHANNPFNDYYQMNLPHEINPGSDPETAAAQAH